MTLSWSTGRLVGFAIIFLLATSRPFASPAPTEHPAGCTLGGVGADSFCDVRGVRLHFVDWGGKGPAIVLLAGLGNSARIFDELAPMLTAGHQVIAISRRGYGQSEQPATGYSNEALVKDVLGVMDGLSISRASFVGHSIAGGELATLAADYPDRVERLVYLDAAYDRSRVLEIMREMPPIERREPAAFGSLAELTRWREATLGVQTAAVGEDLQEIVSTGPEGLSRRTPISIDLQVIAGDAAAKPRYEDIEAPSLAIYSSKDVADQIPPGTSAHRTAQFVQYSTRVIRPWMLRAQAAFLERQDCGTALELPRSTHYFFLARPDWTAGIVLSFLDSPTPCDWAPPLRTRGRRALSPSR